MAKAYIIDLKASTNAGHAKLLMKINDGQNPSAQFVLTNVGENECQLLGANNRTIHILPAGATVIYAIQSEDVNLLSHGGTKVLVEV